MDFIRYSACQGETVSLGSWRIQDGVPLREDRGHEVEQLWLVQPTCFCPMQGHFVQWAKLDEYMRSIVLGTKFPPIDAMEDPTGVLVIMNGQHRWLSHFLLDRPLLTWVNPKGSTGLGLTYEELTGKQWPKSEEVQSCGCRIWRQWGKFRTHEQVRAPVWFQPHACLSTGL